MPFTPKEKKQWDIQNKLNDPNRYLKRKRPITDRAKIADKGMKFNSGYYYNYHRLAKVLAVSYEAIRCWVIEGKLPAGQFEVRVGEKIRYLWGFEEVCSLAILLDRYYEMYDHYDLMTEEGRQLRDDIYEIFKVIYDGREKNGLEKYQPRN